MSDQPALSMRDDSLVFHQEFAEHWLVPRDTPLSAWMPKSRTLLDCASEIAATLLIMKLLHLHMVDVEGLVCRGVQALMLSGTCMSSAVGDQDLNSVAPQALDIRCVQVQYVIKCTCFDPIKNFYKHPTQILFTKVSTLQRSLLQRIRTYNSFFSYFFIFFA
jgi:hypothetical protein